ncbi:MAG TPA: ABC transporter ATP-binding protein [Dehalococcoidia bacterium]|nr:ABC transporter ATP-binding protein [Dehalococcoidia bacterium]
MTSRLEVRGLRKDFRSHGSTISALEDLNLQVEPGEFVCIVGASGSGKSTLLSIVAGLTEPTAGEVLLDGEPVEGPGPDRGLVFQSYSLYPWRSVAGNIAFGLEVAGLDSAEIQRRVDRYLDVMHLTQWKDARPSQLSGGMRQRVAIARSLATEPEVLLLDEPFGALDAHTKSLMQDFLLDIWRQTNTTVLMVTHDVEEAIYLAQRIYVLSSHPGRVKREVIVPFGPDRPRTIRRDERFLDLRDEIQDMLLAEVSEV